MTLGISEFDDFDRDLTRVEELVSFIIAYRAFGSGEPDEEVEGESEFTQSARRLHILSSRIRTDLPIIVGSLLLYTCGRFEFFVTELVKSTADTEIEKVETFSELSSEIRDSLKSQLLVVLNTPTKYAHLKLSEEQLAQALARVVTGGETGDLTTVPTEVMASTDANMRPTVLKEVMSRVGLKEVLTEISKQAPLRTHFDARTEGECRTAATGFLEEVMRLRNSIAHPTASLAFPSPETMLETCASFRALAQAIRDVANLPR